MIVRKHLEFTVQAARRFSFGDGFGLREKFILEFGTEYPNRIDLPPGVEYGRAKECFTNAFNLAVHDESSRFTYVEGYAYTPGVMACTHAWVIDADGNVIDPTWRDGGYECPFCEEGTIYFRSCMEHEFDIEECGCDEDKIGYYEDERSCDWCKGTSKQDNPHPSRAGTEYLGIPVERDMLVKTVLDKGTYMVLDTREFLDNYKAAMKCKG